MAAQKSAYGQTNRLRAGRSTHPQWLCFCSNSRTAMRQILALSLAVTCTVLFTACSGDPERTKQAFFDNGNRLYEQQKYGEAIVEYRNALQADEKFAEARLQLARSYEKTKDRTHALQEFVRAADLMPADDEVQVKAGQLLAEAGRFEDARSRAETVLARSPRNVEAQMLLGHTVAGMKDLDGAISEIEEAIQIAPEDLRTQTSLGLLQLAKGNHDIAEAAFTRAVELKPESIEARLSLAGFYWTTSNAAAAERELQNIIAREPGNPTANRALATFYVITNKIPQAEPYFLKLTEISRSERTLLALADYYTLARRFDDAIRVLERVATEPRSAAVARTKLAMIAYDRRNIAEAHKIVDGVLASEPKNAAALLLKARFALTERKLDDASKLLAEAIAAEPTAASAHYFAGVVHGYLNRLDEAAASFSEALRLNPRLAPAQLQLARVDLARGRARQSEQLARDVLANEPKNPLTRLVLVDSLLAQGDVNAADQELKQLETSFANAPQVYVRRGRVAAARGDMTTARRVFTRALELDPKSVDAISGLAATDVAANRVNEARARLEKHLAASPSDTRLLLLTANVYLSQREWAKAEEVVLRALKTDPTLFTAYDMLGQIQFAQGRLDEAVARFEQLAKDERFATSSGTIVAMILQAQNKTDEARKRYEAIVDRDPKAAAAANNLAWLYAEQNGDLDRAMRLATSARTIAPDEPQIADTIGWINYKRQLPSLAVPEFEAAVRLAPNNALFHYHLGLARIAMNDTSKGVESLKRALSIQPNFAGADDARRLVAQRLGS